MNLRSIAAHAIDKIINGKSLDNALDPMLINLHSHRDRAFVQAMVYGVCRYYDRLDILLSLLLKKPLDSKDTDVFSLLLVGLYQLIDMRVPEHAAVSETVDAVTHLQKPWARPLVNAILRNYLRNKTVLETKLQKDEEAVYSHPLWWITQVKKSWPDYWRQILEASNKHPPMSLRVNLQKISREDYLEKLKAAKMEADIIASTSSGIILKEAVPVEELPGFDSAEVRVQDGASQLAAGLLNLFKGARVLDACAAPGGKLAHILETEPQVSVVALDKDATRLAMLPHAEQIESKKADAAQVDKWWDNNLFDRILLDAPCSASGTVRRHPDIKILRLSTDIPKLAKEQERILNALWTVLKKGGELLYATCSIFPAENNEVIAHFLAAHSDAQEIKIQAEWGKELSEGRQILPGMNNMDGFYYARLRKLA